MVPPITFNKFAILGLFTITNLMSHASASESVCETSVRMVRVSSPLVMSIVGKKMFAIGSNVYEAIGLARR